MKDSNNQLNYLTNKRNPKNILIQNVTFYDNSATCKNNNNVTPELMTLCEAARQLTNALLRNNDNSFATDFRSILKGFTMTSTPVENRPLDGQWKAFTRKIDKLSNKFFHTIIECSYTKDSCIILQCDFKCFIAPLTWTSLEETQQFNTILDTL